jgi:hypothetical protein
LTDDEARTRLGVTNAGLDRKNTIIGSNVAVIFLAIVFTRVIPQIGSYAEAAEYIQAMTATAIFGLIAVTLFYLWVYGWPFVAATPGLTYKSAFIVNQSAFAVSNGIPAGGALGLGLQYAQLTSYRATPTAATAAIGATGIGSMSRWLSDDGSSLPSPKSASHGASSRSSTRRSSASPEARERFRR